MRVRKRFTFYDEFLEMNMAYLYHFCAVAQVANGGTSYCDGVCVCEKLIRGDDGSYNNLKEQIDTALNTCISKLSTSQTRK